MFSFSLFKFDLVNVNNNKETKINQIYGYYVLYMRYDDNLCIYQGSRLH